MLFAELCAGGPFAGRAACARCHEKETREWAASPHGRHAEPQAPADEAADFTVGSRWMEARFRKDLAGLARILPRCYDLREGRWLDVRRVLDEIRGDAAGFPDTPPIRIEERSFEADCAGCHSSRPRIAVDDATGAFRPSFDDGAIDCEACHGPGAAHAEAWSRLDASVPMPRLERLSPRERNALCGRCHGGSAASAEFTPDDAKHFIAPIEDRIGFAPDGAAIGQVYQHPSFLRSPCHSEGGLTCSDCHASHGDALLHRESPDAICTRCHEGFATREHTRHDPKGEAARCVSCHMPRLLTGLVRHQRDHRISIPARNPYGPDACTACHKGPVKEWYEPPQETRDAIEAIARARRGERTPLLEAALRHPDPFFRANAALHLGRAIDDPLPEVRLVVLRVGDLMAGLEDGEPFIRARAYVELLRRGVSIRGDRTSDLRVAARLQRDAVEPRLLLALADRDPRWLEEAILFRPDDEKLREGLRALR